MASKLEQAAQLLAEMREMAQGNAAAMKMVAAKEAAFAKKVEESMQSQPQEVQQRYHELKGVTDRFSGGNTTCYVDITASENGNTVDSLQTLQQVLQGTPQPKPKGTKASNKQIITTIELNLIYIGGIVFDITHQVGTEYKFINVQSSEWGANFSFKWRQGAVTHNVNGEICTITVTGVIDYIVFWEGLGTVYSDRKRYEFDVNTKTGDFVAFREK